jgi:hypothetical protein
VKDERGKWEEKKVKAPFFNFIMPKVDFTFKLKK